MRYAGLFPLEKWQDRTLTFKKTTSIEFMYEFVYFQRVKTH